MTNLRSEKLEKYWRYIMILVGFSLDSDLEYKELHTSSSFKGLRLNANFYLISEQPNRNKTLNSWWDTSLITYCDCSDSQPSIHFIFPPPLVLWTFVLVINICVHVQLSIHNIIIRTYHVSLPDIHIKLIYLNPWLCCTESIIWLIQSKQINVIPSPTVFYVLVRCYFNFIQQITDSLIVINCMF